jgi:hypothetical protein
LAFCAAYWCHANMIDKISSLTGAFGQIRHYRFESERDWVPIRDMHAKEDI